MDVQIVHDNKYDRIPVRAANIQEIKVLAVYIGKLEQILGKTKDRFAKDTFIDVFVYRYDGKIRVGDRMV